MPNSFLVPASRRPRGLVKINGQIVPLGCWIDFEIDNNSFFSADSFVVRLSSTALDRFAESSATSRPNQCVFAMTTDVITAQQDMYIELLIGFPKDPSAYGEDGLVSWMYGQVDDLSYDPVECVISLQGRDLTRVFIDAKTTQKWPNLSASQIATQLALSHGLDTTHIVKTTEKAGRFYDGDHINLADERSEWDLLNYLASQIDFVVFVRGKSLYFQPKPTPKNTEPYKLVWKRPDANNGVTSANVERVTMTRTLTVSRGIQVVIRSWNKKHAKGFVARYPSTVKSIKVGQAKIGDGAQIFSKTIPNLTQEEALQQAQSWYNQLVAHEMKISVDMPGDNEVDTTSIIDLSGTGTAFDQNYYPDSIRRTLSFSGGYSMTISAKNHAPDSQIGVI